MRGAIILLLASCTTELVSETEQGLATSITWTTGSTPYSSLKTQQLDLVCPRGMVGTQLGFGADDGAHTLDNVAFATEPLTPGRWRLRATDLSGSSSWHIEGVLTCIPALPTYEIVTAATAPSSAPSQQLHLACPKEKVVLGAAFQPFPEGRPRAAGEVIAQLTYSMPAVDASSWDANARALTTASWGLRGWLVCAGEIDLPGYHTATHYGFPITNTVDHADADCNPYARALGGGWGAVDNALSYFDANVMLDFHSHTGWQARIHFDKGPTNPWRPVITAVCVL